MNERITTLMKFLDDDNDHTAGAAMAELIGFGDELAPYLSEYQEHEHPLVRKRVHQLQAILTVRQRRNNFAEVLRHPEDLISGLIQVHLQWYDNDSEPHLRSLWQSLRYSAEKFPPANPTTVAYLMRKCSFTTIPGNDFQPDFFCFGTVMESRTGADFILCAIAKVIAEEHGCKMEIIRRYGNFMLTNGKNIILPKEHWRLVDNENENLNEVWDNAKIIRLDSSMLFLTAVSSDSFRYISTIGKSLAELNGSEPLDFLPYPYNETKTPREE